MLCDTPNDFNATGWGFSLDFVKVYLTTNMLATDGFNEIKKLSDRCGHAVCALDATFWIH